MPTHMLRNTLAAVLIGAAVASSATAQDITVTGPGERVVGRTDYGAEVVEHTASLAVDIRDLDLANPAGWDAMERRLTNASQAACNIVDQRIPIDLRDDRYECERAAYHNAIVRIRELRNLPGS